MYALSCPVTEEEAAEIGAELRALVDATDEVEVRLDCRGMEADRDGARMLASVDVYARRKGRLLILVGAHDPHGLLAGLMLEEW